GGGKSVGSRCGRAMVVLRRVVVFSLTVDDREPYGTSGSCLTSFDSSLLLFVTVTPPVSVARSSFSRARCTTAFQEFPEMWVVTCPTQALDDDLLRILTWSFWWIPVPVTVPWLS